MKTIMTGIGTLGFIIAAAAGGLSGAEPLQAQKKAVSDAFGMTTVESTRLMKSEKSKLDPLVWLVFAEDTHRKSDLVKIRLERETGRMNWRASSVAAGTLLQRVPPMRLDWFKVKVGPTEARYTAELGARLAKVAVEQVEFQLATQPSTNAPEWALTLYDAQGLDVGFVVVSAETGAVIHQDFSSPQIQLEKSRRKSADNVEDIGEEAAKSVKRGVRNAWDWTEKASRETRGFFRELFR